MCLKELEEVGVRVVFILFSSNVIIASNIALVSFSLLFVSIEVCELGISTTKKEKIS